MQQSFSRKEFMYMTALAGIGWSFSTNAFGRKRHTPLKGKNIGIIGLDTSHAVAFAKALNESNTDPAFMGYRFAAAYPKGSNDIASSIERVSGYTEEVKKLGVEIVNSIPELLKKVDAVCLETNDGRLHLEQALMVLKARKPLFIDKPMAASLKDAVAIFEAAKKYNTPVFSSSSLRYITGIDEVQKGGYGKIIGATTYSPAKLEKTHPDFFWYGIHGVEMLFTIMGSDCESVTRVHTADTDLAIGTWKDGRVGSFRGTRSGKADYGGIIFAEKKNIVLGAFKGYLPLLQAIIRFFETGQPPVSEKETLAILAFMEAADESKHSNGAAVTLQAMYQKAGYKNL